jgi:hypothetical protein
MMKEMRTAKIEIKVSEPKENLPQDQWQRITRAANMLRANDFDVDIMWDANKKKLSKAVA